MKKFECKVCDTPCVLTLDSDLSIVPSLCPYLANKSTDWHEVKEDSAETSQTSVKQEKLPDWVKAGKWGYDKSLEKYFEIVIVRKPFNVEVAYLDDAWTTIIGIPVFNDDCVQANKRPFNDKEMQAIVGKNLETPSFVKFIFSYDKEEGTLESYDFLYTADDLFEDDFKFEGKPCYKLEHLNEKGEWVE